MQSWCFPKIMTFSFFIHGQIGANLLHLARVAMLDCGRHKMLDVSKAEAELDMAKNHLHNSIRLVLVWHAYLFHNYFWITKLKKLIIRFVSFSSDNCSFFLQCSFCFYFIFFVSLPSGQMDLIFIQMFNLIMYNI